MNYLIPEIVWQKLLLPNNCSGPVPVQGGLSQAGVFRCVSPHGLSPHGPKCLRSWPSDVYPSDRLNAIAEALQSAREAGLDFIPAYFRSSDGTLYVKDGRQMWELTEWLPGSPSYHLEPSLPRLKAAISSLAKLHAVWRKTSSVGTSPAVHIRRSLLASLLDRKEPQTWYHHCRDESERKLIQETADSLRQHAARCDDLLQHLAADRIVLHACIRDIRCEHVLFTGDEVTGIVDFGALQIDEPATDLARLLGTAEPFSHQKWLQGWEFYADLDATLDRRRAAILDYSSCLLSAVQSARWLIMERRSFPSSREQCHQRWYGFLLRLRENDWQTVIG